MTPIQAQGYEVLFAKKAYDSLIQHIKENNYSLIVILVDENTHELCLPGFLGNLHTDCDLEIIEAESGEQNKTIETCMGIWNAMSELDIDRNALMINLGGGVVTDMGGFIASTYKRGIDFINIPTTLLSMVDASVGGKTGVDLGNLKNQIGVINYPKMVIINPDFLNTLPHNQLVSGFAEMLKHGLIKDANYWNTLCDLSSLTTNDLEGLIHRSVELKNEVVSEDPYENGIRKILNFGHTLGHAIESHFLDSKPDKALLHGEAIAIGMILEIYISHKLIGFPLYRADEIKKQFLSYFKKVDITQKDIEKIIDILRFDKKNSHGKVNFVLLEKLEKPLIDKQVPRELIIESFGYYDT